MIFLYKKLGVTDKKQVNLEGHIRNKVKKLLTNNNKNLQNIIKKRRNVYITVKLAFKPTFFKQIKGKHNNKQ